MCSDRSSTSFRIYPNTLYLGPGTLPPTLPSYYTRTRPETTQNYSFFSLLAESQPALHSLHPLEKKVMCTAHAGARVLLFALISPSAWFREQVWTRTYPNLSSIWLTEILLEKDSWVVGEMESGPKNRNGVRVLDTLKYYATKSINRNALSTPKLSMWEVARLVRSYVQSTYFKPSLIFWPPDYNGPKYWMLYTMAQFFFWEPSANAYYPPNHVPHDTCSAATATWSNCTVTLLFSLLK